MKWVTMTSPLPNMGIWGAGDYPYSFIITEERDKLTGDDWLGFHASWKDARLDMTPHGAQPSNKIDGAPFRTLEDAKAACEATLMMLRRKQ